MSNISKTFYLFARPSFVRGMGRVLDLGSTMQIYNNHDTPEEADCEAIKKDWQAVGFDIQTSIEKYEQGQSTNR